MPVAYSDGDTTGIDPFKGQLNTKGVLNHGHLAENDNHGGGSVRPARRADAHGRARRRQPASTSRTSSTAQGDLSMTGKAGRPPVVRQGRRLTFVNLDSRRDDLPHDHRLQGALQRHDRHRLPAGGRARRLRLRRARLRAGGHDGRGEPQDLEDAEQPQARHVHVLLPRAPVHARVVQGGRPIAQRPALAELQIADPPQRWAALGFAVERDGGCRVGTIRLALGAGGAGITGWSLRGIPAMAGGSIDGLATRVAGDGDGAVPDAKPEPHPNGAVGLDHVVVATPDFERTCGALQAAGLPRRRVREAGPTALQGFFLLGDAILEVVGPRAPDGDGPAAFWGLVAVTADLDATCAHLGDLAGPPREAVQPGRRIATVRRAAGLGTALAFMSPR